MTMISFNTTWDTIATHTKTLNQKMLSLYDNINTLAIQPTLECVEKCKPIVLQKLKALGRLVLQVAKIAIAIIVLKVQPTVFLLGAAAAIVYPESMRRSIDSIVTIWKAQSHKMQFAAVIIAALEWPSFILIAAPFVGVASCLYFRDKAGIPMEALNA